MRAEDHLAQQQAYWELKENSNIPSTVKKALEDAPGAVIRSAAPKSPSRLAPKPLGDFKITEAVGGKIFALHRFFDRLS